jgi:sulfate adenylyltransferase subunit 2
MALEWSLRDGMTGHRQLSAHLRALEAEALFILREAVACAERPVLLYSVGKDSSVMLRLAQKAFFTAPLPFPVLHIDTTWKFKEMIAFRDSTAASCGVTLIVHTNHKAVARGVNPFDYDPECYTRIMKTEALKEALCDGRFDVAICGARRDEEKSRSKERVFSVRGVAHSWDPKNQRPELWQLFNTRLRSGESLRVFPLSNWTELDVWEYILADQIPVVPLYCAASRPVVQRGSQWIVVDDHRMRLRPGEVPRWMSVRFRTLGCYPLTAAVESTAADVEAIVRELSLTRLSERAGRLIDHDRPGSMEIKKRDGYF